MATPDSHAEVEVADVGVGTVLVPLEKWAKITQDCPVLLGIGLIPSWLSHHTRDDMLLQGVWSKHPSKKVRCREVHHHAAQMNDIGIPEFRVHVSDTSNAESERGYNPETSYNFSHQSNVMSIK